MAAVQEPGPEWAQGDRRQPNPRLGLIDRWAHLAGDQPWRYAAIWAIGIGVANLGLRMLLTTAPWPATRLAILTAVGFLAFAWVYTAQLTRSFRGQRPRPAANPAIPTQGCAAGWSSAWPPLSGRSARSQWLWSCPQPVKAPGRRVGRPPGHSTSRRRLILATVAAAITLVLLVGAIPSRPAPGGGHDVVVPSWGD